MTDGAEPIADDELLYRRVPASTGWYDPGTASLKREAFAPHKLNDGTGLSLHRAKYATPADVASSGRVGKSYYVAVLRAGELRARGILIEPRPEPGNPGHAELPDLNSDNRKGSAALETEEILVDLVESIEGAFSVPTP